MNADPAPGPPRLGFGLSFAELADRAGLVRLDQLFLAQLATEDAGLHARLLAARAAPGALDDKAGSELIVALGPHLDAFVATLFGIETRCWRWRSGRMRSIRCTPASGCSCSARR